MPQIRNVDYYNELQIADDILLIYKSLEDY